METQWEIIFPPLSTGEMEDYRKNSIKHRNVWDETMYSVSYQEEAEAMQTGAKKAGWDLTGP